MTKKSLGHFLSKFLKFNTIASNDDVNDERGIGTFEVEKTSDEDDAPIAVMTTNARWHCVNKHSKISRQQ